MEKKRTHKPKLPLVPCLHPRLKGELQDLLGPTLSVLLAVSNEPSPRLHSFQHSYVSVSLKKRHANVGTKTCKHREILFSLPSKPIVALYIIQHFYPLTCHLPLQHHLHFYFDKNYCAF